MLKPRIARAVLSIVRMLRGRGPDTMRADWLRRRFQAEARYLRTLRLVEGLRFRPAHRSLCHAAAHLAGCWRVGAAPEFPPRACEEPGGCRCTIEWLFAADISRIVFWQSTRP